MCAGAALADQIVGSKAYRNHVCTFAMVFVALAQFVVTGLLPLSSDLFFILGALTSSRISQSIGSVSRHLHGDTHVFLAKELQVRGFFLISSSSNCWGKMFCKSRVDRIRD